MNNLLRATLTSTGYGTNCCKILTYYSDWIKGWRIGDNVMSEAVLLLPMAGPIPTAMCGFNMAAHWLQCMHLTPYPVSIVKISGVIPSPLDSIRDAVLTVSPKRQNRGIFCPTTPATTGPKIKTYDVRDNYYNS